MKRLIIDTPAIKAGISCSLLLPAMILAFLFVQVQGRSQIMNEKTKKRISIGVGLFSDIWLNMPAGVKDRAINQGANVFATYNVPFGKSYFSFAIGLGISAHNLYGNYIVDTSTTTSVSAFKKIPDSLDYKKSKINTDYLEIPLEFRFKSRNKITVALGFKLGYLIGSFWKYVGDGNFHSYYYTLDNNEKTRIKLLGVKNLETIAYGPTFRFGYRWINVNVYYQLSKTFKSGQGPQVSPVSVGFVLMPF
jgi:hypothetical protein